MTASGRCTGAEKELSEGVEKYRADMDKDFLKEKLEELKAADTDIVEEAIAAFSAGATISEVRTARAAKADSIESEKDLRAPLDRTF